MYMYMYTLYDVILYVYALEMYFYNQLIIGNVLKYRWSNSVG